MQYMGSEDVPPVFPLTPLTLPRHATSPTRSLPPSSSTPKLYVLGSPPASVVVFGARDASVNMYEIGDRMSKKGLHLNTLSGPVAMHRVDVANRRNVYFKSQGVCGGNEECAGGKGKMVTLYRYVVPWIFSFPCVTAAPYALLTLYRSRKLECRRPNDRRGRCKRILGYAIQGVKERYGRCRGLIYWTIVFFLVLLACPFILLLSPEGVLPRTMDQRAWAAET